jgi:hypothetical protein
LNPQARGSRGKVAGSPRIAASEASEIRGVPAAPRSEAERIRLLHSPWPKRLAAGEGLRIEKEERGNA